ncbi:MAG: hypothetical protein WC047_04315 [Kiritimatiellales bacterium]
MSKKNKPEASELDVAGLLALKTYERPDAHRAEKNIQNIMRTVRTTSNMPSLLLFPDKSSAWMFAQPRYGVAALFVLFLGLHLLERPMPAALIGSTVIKEPAAPGTEIMTSVDTNQLKAAAIPGISPSFSVAGEPIPLSSYIK